MMADVETPVRTSGGVILLGGGGHARAVADVIRRLGGTIAAVADPNGSDLGVPVMTDDAAIDFARREGFVIVPATGNNARRLDLIARATAADAALGAIVARTATVAADARLGPGTVVLEHAHVGPRAFVGAGCIVNTAAVVEHDTRLGDGAHVAPHATLAGHAELGHRSLLGAGAVVIPGVIVGADVVVGAGAVVVRPIDSHATVVGVPATEVTE